MLCETGHNDKSHYGHERSNKMGIYKKEHQSEISFPLGGIGSGSIGLAGTGRLIDWEINNRPNRVSINSFTNFAIKAEDEEKVLDYRVLQGDIENDYMGTLYNGNHSWGYGHGPNRGTLAGMKHFEDVTFTGEYPFANINFVDERFPGLVEMEAFNPFIPSNDGDSSIPAAFFTLKVTNPTTKPLKYTVAFSVTNPLKSPGKHYYQEDGPIKKIIMSSNEADKNVPDFGNACIATDGEHVSYQECWYRGGWFDNLTMFTNDLSTYGPFNNRVYDEVNDEAPDTSVLAVTLDVAPGETKDVRYILSWYVPNVWKYWTEWGEPDRSEVVTDWRNYYAKLFESSHHVANYCLREWKRLYGDTMTFKKTLFNSELPEVVLDAIQGNIAILKSTTCLRLTDGSFYAWEGVNKERGSCEGTCQHVWNYAYALPFLFPQLERSVRDLELEHSLGDEGGIRFRLKLPVGTAMSNFRSCVDGQMGTVMKCYREWKISGDTQWLRNHWEGLKKCIEFAWSKENKDKWDEHKTGVMYGRQHHTLDVELFGPNSWLTGFYHGALLAGAEMADAMGEKETAREYRELYLKGHQWIEENTFNGTHYIQKLDIEDKSLVDYYGDDESINMKNGYWDEEIGQIKYQIGNGCEIDQVVADWHAELMGLPHIFDQEHRKKALETLYKLNFVSMRDIANPCRVFAANGEEGLVMCNWDEGVEKPKISIPYTEEVMTGFEYAAAANMLQCGMEEQAHNVVKAVRDRYDGKKRNPWAEIECGASYSRAMASYSFLLIYSGFKYDMTIGLIGFVPKKHGQYFWSIDGAWGQVNLQENKVEFTLLYGELTIQKFLHSLKNVSSVTVDDKAVDFIAEDGCIKVDVTMNKHQQFTLVGEQHK